MESLEEHIEALIAWSSERRRVPAFTRVAVIEIEALYAINPNWGYVTSRGERCGLKIRNSSLYEVGEYQDKFAALQREYRSWINLRLVGLLKDGRMLVTIQWGGIVEFLPGGFTHVSYGGPSDRQEWELNWEVLPE